MKNCFTLLAILSCYFSFSQNVGIGTNSPNTSSQLEISSASKGLLIPRMTTSTINAIGNPAKGLMVYDSIKNQLMVNMGTATSKNWQTVVFNSGWNLTGNTSIDPSNQFIGTIDNQPLRFRVNNNWAGELHPLSGSVFVGLRAGQSNTTGFSNIAFGTDALRWNTDRGNLVAIGDSALFNNSNGATQPYHATRNTAIGSKALYSNRSGYGNTAGGWHALYSNIGDDAQGGSANTAVGLESLSANITGSSNTAVGFGSLAYNTDGWENVAVGGSALWVNTSSLGSFNTAVGMSALGSTTASQYNTALGFNAGSNYDHGYNNTFVGAFSNINSSGYYNCIAVGKSATCTGASQARIGNSSTISIGGYTTWTNFSDGRYKKDISEINVKGLDFIMKLRPVTYHLDVSGLSKKLDEGSGHELDKFSKQAIAEKEKILYSGFVAQDVEKAALETGYDFSGVDKPRNENDLYGLRYAEFVVPLVKAMQEQQSQIEELKKDNKIQKDINNLLQKQIDEMKALIKK